MEDIQVFQHIQVPYKQSLIYTRLGYEKTNTKIEPERKRQIDKWIMEAHNLCHITVLYKKLSIVQNTGKMVVLSGGIEFCSNALARLLHHSTEAVFMAATSGSLITNEIKRLQEDGEIAKSLVYDAAASEITDAGLDWLAAYIRQPLLRKGQNLTYMRYSAGYGDLTLENQEVFYHALKMEKWGIQLTEKYIFLPEKTVTAIIGIEMPGT